MFNSDRNAPFGVGPGVPTDIVPDPGSTLFLLSLAMLGPILAWPGAGLASAGGLNIDSLPRPSFFCSRYS